MANECARGALRGEEERIFDLAAETCTPKQWAGLMQPFLEHAAGRGDEHLTRKLVEAGAEIRTAVHAAVRGGHCEITEFLLESGASASASDEEGLTPLHLAAQADQGEIARLLLLRGVDQDSSSYEGRTPLNCAACLGHASVAEVLLSAGADINRRYGDREISALDIGAGEGHIDFIRTLIEHGADVDATNYGGVAALHHATANNKVEAMDVLLRAGANPRSMSESGHTVLHMAAITRTRTEAATLAVLLKYGADVNAQTVRGTSVLEYVATRAGREGIMEVVDLLLRWGADEAHVAGNGMRAADVIGMKVPEEDRIPEEVEGVRKLLANAPADRAWRRRRSLVLCRAQPDRVQLSSDGIARLEARVLGLVEEGIFRTIVRFI
ncbi:unnamed protein product [Ectocarpus sp. 13 AM-2016]